MQNTLRYISIVYLVLLSVGLFAHVEIIPGILTVVKRDAWLSVVLAIIVLPVWIFVIYKILAIVHTDSLLIKLKNDTSSIQYYLLLLPIGLYMYISAFITAKDIIFWSQLTYMEDYNIFFLAFPLLLLCLICSQSGIFSIGIISTILCPIVLVLGFFISFANTNKKNYELLLPILEDGFIPVSKGLIYTVLPIIELFVIIFVTSIIKKRVTKKQLFVLGIVIVGLMLGPTIGAIVEFGPDLASKYRYPAYEQWRLISIGRYISHTDFFAIYQWLSGGVIRISLFVLLTSLIATKNKNNIKVLGLLYGLLFIAVLVPVDQNVFSEMVFIYFRPISLIVLLIQISVLAVFLRKRKKVERS
ncbi:GerAB/ArcD/ProY family transporter [Metabacillus niabensis]|uniref:Spore germination protein (Amino acid permease) n=1 Tax=Metabacillus niabensis TaxID=324854 RepID=A0ABT9Z2R5_9BACI|nr:GerAB/ArcD/ProY family transporter [Metabacillus niabensis]MDQ0226131.1 spore germination protein (amino acid permease) [Metabacillus niabensis]